MTIKSSLLPKLINEHAKHTVSRQNDNRDFLFYRKCQQSRKRIFVGFRALVEPKKEVTGKPE